MFVPHHERIAAAGASPGAWLVFLHGILGSGANWRTFARRLVDRRPDWGAVLVDLRMHGQSQDAPGPHTLAAAAGDVVALVDLLDRDGAPVGGVAGHSFGGKVALSTADQRPIARVWVLDADPAPDPDGLARPAGPARVLDHLAALPRRMPSRADFVRALVDRGLDRGLAQWLAMNVVPDGDAYRLRLDIAAVRGLLASYYAADLWPAADRIAARAALHFVLGGQSDVVSAASRARMHTLRATVDVIEAAGHWLHVDAPDALRDVIARDL
ncbi:MAG: alpha/beta hydrolase [Deltaproteobacteria bacterium]|nr:MAG: alpha/beta hydrolase [Deltaproteobacteria bacterium]